MRFASSLLFISSLIITTPVQSQASLSAYDTKMYIRNKFKEFAYHRDRGILVNFFQPTIMDLEFDTVVNNEDDEDENRRERMTIDLPYVTDVWIIGERLGEIQITCNSSCITMGSGVRRSRARINFAISPKIEAERIGRAIRHLAELYKERRRSDPFD